MPAPTKALVVLSGGQDSTTCLAWAKRRYSEVHAITFDYDQRHAVEITAALRVAALIGVASHEVVKLGPILKGRSPLTNPAESLEQYADHAQMAATIGDRVELTFVPMRNALFLTLAANRAACLGGKVDIVTGVCEADNANYPDCRADFINSQQETIGQALGSPYMSSAGNLICITTPLINMTKAQSIGLAVAEGGYELLAFSHTAYDGQYPPLGHDHATILRAHGFVEAGLPDPLVVRAWSRGLMQLPQTPNYANHDNIAELAVEVDRMAGILDSICLGDVA